MMSSDLLKPPFLKPLVAAVSWRIEEGLRLASKTVPDLRVSVRFAICTPQNSHIAWNQVT